MQVGGSPLNYSPLAGTSCIISFLLTLITIELFPTCSAFSFEVLIMLSHPIEFAGRSEAKSDVESHNGIEDSSAGRSPSSDVIVPFKEQEK